MGEFETNSTFEPGSVELIYGYRSGSGNSGGRVKNTCDIRFTAYDPFDFAIEWRTKWVKTRRSRVSKSGRKYFYNARVFVPYPYYNFVEKTRSVKEWRLLMSAGQSVLDELPERYPRAHILKVLGWLKSRLKRYGKCRVIKPQSAHIQHGVTHWKSVIDKIIPTGYYTHEGGAWSVPYVSNGHYGYRAFEIESNYVGETGDGPNIAATETLNINLVNKPQSVLFSNDTVSTVAAMLWPASGDMEDIGSTPLIDLGEAVSDGVFPLGPPPNAVDAHERMVKNAMNDDIWKSLTNVVDFAADSYLWATLVFEPVIQSAIGLSVSVKANDKAIDAYTSLAKSNKWQQGKSLRLFGRDPAQAGDCLGVPPVMIHNVENTSYTGSIIHSIDRKKIEGNASMVYKLSEFDAAQMNTSGMRLSQFFNRLSVSLDTVVHNVLPLSFVFDWFSSEYAGILNLKDKIYLPVSDWKLTMSYNFAVDIESNSVTNALYYTRELWDYTPASNHWMYGYVPESWVFVRYDTGLNHFEDTSDIYIPNGTKYWVYKNIENQTLEVQRDKTVETHRFYRRLVFDKPLRRTDFSNGEVGIECFDTTKGPLEDTGKMVTLGALLWGATGNLRNLPKPPL